MGELQPLDMYLFQISNQDEIEDIEPPEESGLLNNIDDITEDGVGNIDELNGSISSEENYIEDLAKLSNEHSKP